jgi:hypothetical protein
MMKKKNGRTGAGGGQQGEADGAGAAAGVPPLRALTTAVGQVERDKGAAPVSFRAPDGGLRVRWACVACVCVCGVCVCVRVS